jgi:hypothetical protein
VSYTGVTCHKPNKKKRWNMSAIRWDKVAGNDKKRNAACKGCKHWDQHGDCSYILNEGHRRSVPINPGGGCEKKDAGVKVKGGEFILTDRQKRKAERAKQRDFDREKAAELYEMGDNDVAISNKLGCKKWDILFWRQETGRPSNYRRKEKAQ